MPAQTKFYISRQDNGDTYELSATQKCSISESARITDRRVESGKTLSDNYYLMNRVITFNGVITNIRNNSSVEDITKWLKEIRDLRKEDPPVMIDVQANDQFIPNCLIEDLDIDTDHITGVGAWKVNMRIKEVQLAEKALLTEIPEPKETRKDDVSSTKSKSTNTTQDREVTETIFSSTPFTVDNIPVRTPSTQPSTGGG